jgi:molybdopterin synthase catalytic subunit
MKVRVLFFGATADAAGKREAQIEIDDGSDTATAADLVLENYPSLKHHKLLFAVNEEYADPGHMILDGDELAIFTPVSGG